MSLWSAPSNDTIGRGGKNWNFSLARAFILFQSITLREHTLPHWDCCCSEGLLNSSWNCPQCLKLLFLDLLKGGKSLFFIRGSALWKKPTAPGIQCGWPGQPGYLLLPFPLHPKQSARMLLLIEVLEDLSKVLSILMAYIFWVVGKGYTWMFVCGCLETSGWLLVSSSIA